MPTPEEEQRQYQEELRQIMELTLRSGPVRLPKPERKDMFPELSKFSASTPSSLPNFDEEDKRAKKRAQDIAAETQEGAFGVTQTAEILFADGPGFFEGPIGTALTPIVKGFGVADNLTGDRLTDNFKGLEALGEVGPGTAIDALRALQYRADPEEEGLFGVLGTPGIPNFGDAFKALQEGLGPLAPGSPGGIQMSPGEINQASREYQHRSLLEQLILDPLNLGAAGLLKPGMKAVRKHSADRAAQEAKKETIRDLNELGEEATKAGFNIADYSVQMGEGPLPRNILGLTMPELKLSWDQRLRNWVKDWNLDKPRILDNALVQPMLNNARFVRQNADSMASSLSLKYDSMFHGPQGVFTFGRQGGIPGLAGIDPTLVRTKKQLREAAKAEDPALGIPGVTEPLAPTLVDVARRLPVYAPHLTDTQMAALMTLKRDLADFKELLDRVYLRAMGKEDKALLGKFEQKMKELVEVGEHGSDEFVELQKRHAQVVKRNLPIPEEAGDIMKSVDGQTDGFYVSRGGTMRELEEASTGPTGAVGGKPGSLKHQRYDSQAQGIANGEKYLPFLDNLASYITETSSHIIDKEMSTYFKSLTDEAGNPLGTTAKDRLLAQNPDLHEHWVRLNKELNRLKGLDKSLSNRLEDTVNNWIANPEFDDINKLIDSLTLKVGKGKNVGATQPEVRKAVGEVKSQLEDLRPRWNRAKDIANDVPENQRVLNIKGMQPYAFPQAIAEAFNDGVRSGKIKPSMGLLNTVNTTYRFMGATADISYMGIQGLAAAYTQPALVKQSIGISLDSWVDPQVLGAFFIDFDTRSLAAGKLSIKQWTGEFGLRAAGRDTEYSLRGFGKIGKLADVTLFKEVNRSFGFFGDSLRAEWADELLQYELNKGRTLDEIINSGDAHRIAEVANNMTGWARGRAGGSVGDMLLFAPRFLQSRLETVSKAVASLDPTKAATVSQVAARRSMYRMIGMGTMATFAINKLLGNDTQLNPLKPNFMTIRWGGRDISLFGTWDSLLKGIILVTQGTVTLDPSKFVDAVDNMGSGVVNIGTQIVTGTDYAEEDIPGLGWLNRSKDRPIPPIEIAQDPWGFLTWVMKQVTPFSLGDVPDSLGLIQKGFDESGLGNVYAGLAGLGLEATGFKSSPLSVFEKLVEARKAGAKKLGFDNDDLSIPQRNAIDEIPEVAALMEEVATSRRARDSGWQKYLDEQGDLHEEINAKIEAAAETSLKFGNHRIFRENVDKWEKTRSDRAQQIRTSNAEAIKFLDEFDPGQNEWDVNFGRYMDAATGADLETTDNPTNTSGYVDDLGFYDWRERQRRIDELGFSPELIAQFEDVLARHDLPYVRELNAARKRLRPYWEQRDKAFDSVEGWRLEALENGKDTLHINGQPTSIPIGSESIYDLAKAYAAFDSDKKKFLGKPELADRFAPYILATRLERVNKENWRRGADIPEGDTQGAQARSDLERLAVEWGYLSTTLNPLNLGATIENAVEAILKEGQTRSGDPVSLPVPEPKNVFSGLPEFSVSTPSSLPSFDEKDKKAK
jgi:hypothetical protein